MRSTTTRSLAITVGGLVLTAALATPVLAQSDEEPTAPASTPGMASMKMQMMAGDMTDMTDMTRMERMEGGRDRTRMHGPMMTGHHLGMAHMADRMTTDKPQSKRGMG